MLALTATASPSTRTSIMDKLCMEKANVVVGNCDRKNIILNCVKAPYDEHSAFSLLIESLMTQKHQCPKTIIYCRSIKSCSILYKLFTDPLKDNAYSGIQSANNRLFHSIPCKCKKNCYGGIYKIGQQVKGYFLYIGFWLRG